MRSTLGLGIAAASLGLLLSCGSDSDSRPNTGTGGNAGSDAGDASVLPEASTDGSSVDSGSDGTGGVSFNAFCAAVGQSYAAWLVYCYQGDSSQFPTDVYEKNCLKAETAIKSGRLLFNGNKAAACLTALPQNSCDGFVYFEDKAECSGLFAGSVGLGNACYPDATRFFAFRGVTECAAGYCDGSACPGTCKAFKKSGEACADSKQCGAALYCNNNLCASKAGLGAVCGSDEACQAKTVCLKPDPNSQGTCALPSKVGDPCSGTAPCSSGFWCIGGACRTKVKAGEPCEVALNCAGADRCVDADGSGPLVKSCGPPGQVGASCGGGPDCAPGLYCLSATKQCIQPVGAGKACDTLPCASGLWCRIEAAGKFCKQSGGAGADCFTGLGTPGGMKSCQTGLYCMLDGKCHAPGAVGGACNGNVAESCQSGLWCSRQDATCELPVAMGAFCNPGWNQSCQSGLGCTCSGPSCTPGSWSSIKHDPQDTCQTLKADGTPCAYGQECLSGNCGGPAEQCVTPTEPPDCLGP